MTNVAYVCWGWCARKGSEEFTIRRARQGCVEKFRGDSGIEAGVCDVTVAV